MRALPFTTALFDVDGTLIDSNAAHARTWAQALREHAIDVDTLAVRRLIGMGGDKLLPAIANLSADSAEGKAIGARKKALFAEELPRLSPTPGARDLLEFLRQQGVTLAVASSADDEELDALLAQAGVNDLFKRRASKTDAAESKPAPDIVHAALDRSGARAEMTVMVGDTPYDVEAATRAGVRVVAVRSGGYWPDADLAGAMTIADDPAALLAEWQR